MFLLVWKGVWFERLIAVRRGWHEYIYMCVCVFPLQVQLSLYTYLSAEFIGTATIYNTIRRVGTVLQLMHSLKYYYWAINPADCSGITPKGLGEHILAFWICFSIRQSVCAFLFRFGTLFDLFWFSVYINCFPSVWGLVQVKAQCFRGRIIGSEPITISVCSHRPAIKVSLWNGSSSLIFEMTHPHMEAPACQLLGLRPSVEMTVRQAHHINTVIPLWSLVWVLGLWNLGQ